jgi:hypothetical protein
MPPITITAGITNIASSRKTGEALYMAVRTLTRADRLSSRSARRSASAAEADRGLLELRNPYEAAPESALSSASSC